MRLLLVEDHPPDARFIREMLKEAPAGVVELSVVDRLDRALEAIQRDRPEAALLDLGLPDSHGLGTLTATQSASPELPIVVLTGLDDSTFGVEAVRAGAQDYLVKGRINCEVLLRTINYAVERQRAQRALRDSEARFREVFEQAAVGVAHVTLDGRFAMVNQRYAEIVGRTREELQACTFQVLTHPADLKADLDSKRRLLAGESGTYALEQRYLRKDNTPVWVNLTVSLVRKPSGQPGHFVAVVEDISKRKAAESEIRRLNAGLEERVRERTAQLEAVNRELEAFSYSVSHDLRAPLRHISGFVNLLLESAGEALPKTSRRHLDVIVDSARQMGQLIDDLLAFSRMGRTELKVQTVDLKELLTATLQRLEHETSGRSIVWRLQPLPSVRADRAMLQQVFTNLLSNAIKYTQPRDPAEIEIGATTELPGEVIIHVRDNGVGFDMEYGDKLFGVFRRLHSDDEFEGTGIGLATVRRIIARHGGRTWAEGAVGRGATFFFTLPDPKNVKS